MDRFVFGKGVSPLLVKHLELRTEEAGFMGMARGAFEDRWEGGQ